MVKLSAGLLVYRRAPDIRVFLVHPGGPFWAKRDNGAWSLPKGEYTEEEDPLQAAKREFAEETGQPAPIGSYESLGVVVYGNKKLSTWTIEGDVGAGKVKSNFFEMEWPPKSGQQQTFPEVDRGEWFTLHKAAQKLVKGQLPLLTRLQELLRISGEDQTVSQLRLL